MKEGQKLLAQLHAERQCFVQKAIEEGAHETIREKTVNIGVAATFGPSPLAEIGRSYDETRANASLLYRGFIIELWDNSSKQTRSFQTRKDLLERKPTPQDSRERNSEGHGGRTLEIRGLILSGARSVDELEKQSGLSRRGILRTMRTLKRWGVDVSQFASAIRKNKEKIKQLIREEDDKKIQKIMDGLSTGTVRQNMIKHSKTPKVFTTIGRAASDVYRYKFTETHLFAQDLEENGIPNRRIKIVIKGGSHSVYVLLEKHKDRALAAWEKNPRLERFKVPNPVTIVCGNKNMDIPTVGQLFRSKNYRSVSSVLSDLRIRIHPRHQIEFREWLFEGCPITVWAYQKGRYIAVSDIDQFKQYFFRKCERPSSTLSK